MLDHLKLHLKGKVVILGIGNVLRGDDGIGSLLADRLKGKVPWTVYDAAESPENYLGPVIKQRPDTIVLVDAVDFGGEPGEFRVLEATEIKTSNLFSTHNASIGLTINYLQTNLKADIITLIIQPCQITLGGDLSRPVEETLHKLENWFLETAKETG